MTKFTSNTSINKPLSEVYSFLADFNNHQQLMPDSIQEWVSTADEASFSIPNMAKLSLKIESRITDREIVIIPASKPPFNLELKWSLLFDNDHTDVLFTISADLNMMMKMLASGPLQKLADHETQSLKTILS
ncbi:SRPBCC family protein [Mucilaginibacter aquaedulcis]|uniref:SRPBCC family protein n=1 Tax=Mucilaginibacter aquaedulcis TaxID=1187081 RepID=UPI0025B38A5C|nr:SRPBCC family protein [Mucilaginibacter aquaedulcis]MDN3546908.1 SRPBCC family protein [Mucilaginibacter aquaedulcis]